MRKLVSSLFSKARAELISALVLHPEDEWYLSDLAKHLKVSPSTLQRELARLTAAGILTRRTDGKRVYYKADERCPILPELQGLFLKTAGLVDVIADTLRPFKKKIEFAVIFGSVARGEELAKSDVDLLIVGDVGLSTIATALKRAEGRLRREIQALVYSPEEFRDKVLRKEHFVSSVLNSKTLEIIGSPHGYMEAA